MAEYGYGINSFLVGTAVCYQDQGKPADTVNTMINQQLRARGRDSRFVKAIIPEDEFYLRVFFEDKILLDK